MKTIQQHISERLQLNKDRIQKIKYEYFPETKGELIDNIKDILGKHVDINETNSDKVPVNLNIIDTSKIKDMSELFMSIGAYYERFNYDVSQWYVGHVTDMRAMFYGCHNFNCDLSSWNTSKVRNTICMFYNCYKFEGKGLRYWNVSSVKTMRAMFSRCTVFNEDISRWNISSCEDLSIMFADCKKFNQDISQWDVSKVINIEDIFRDAYNFDQDLTPWTTHGHISKRNIHIKKYIK